LCSTWFKRHCQLEVVSEGVQRKAGMEAAAWRADHGGGVLLGDRRDLEVARVDQHGLLAEHLALLHRHVIVPQPRVQRHTALEEVERRQVRLALRAVSTLTRREGESSMQWMVRI
jgi:hypothetical protein